jgi:citrate lyase beta subunit
MRARRALLYMPGDDMHKIRKAASLGVDCICMDMEDGVAFSRKDAARQSIVAALDLLRIGDLDFGRSECLVRINAAVSGLQADDLAALSAASAAPQGIVLPKVESAGDVEQVAACLSELERAHTWPNGGIILLVQVESALGLVNMHDIVRASPRIQAVIFGAEDYAANVGAQRTPAAHEVAYARSAVVAHAAAYDLQAIDMVYVNFRDPEGLAAEAVQGAQMGFAGKQIIHPSQVEPVQAAFTPSTAEIAHALRVVTAAAEHAGAGRGAFALDGKMVDAPVIKAAERVMARARAAGLAPEM